MVSADLIISRRQQLQTYRGEKLKRKASLQDVELVEHSCVAAYKGNIVFVDTEKELRQAVYLEPGGKSLDDEIKQLKAIKAADGLRPIDLAATFFDPHEVPWEYKARKNEYIDLLTHEILPKVMEKNLAEFFDIFCEEGVYSVAESHILIESANQADLKIKIHADEFAPLGGAQLAVEVRAISAEHLIAITEDGTRRMAESNTAAILFPGVPFFLMQDTAAPARKLIDAGAVVALATDFNPGSLMNRKPVVYYAARCLHAKNDYKRGDQCRNH